MLTANCRNCGSAKTPLEYAMPYCAACEGAVAAARLEALSDKNPDGSLKESPDDAARRVLRARTLNSRQNFLNPKMFNRMGSVAPPENPNG